MPSPIAEPLAHVRLQVDRGQVAAVATPALGEPAITLLAVDLRREADRVDEPGAPVIDVVGERRLDAVDAVEQLA